MSNVYLITIGDVSYVSYMFKMEEHSLVMNRHVILQGNFLKLSTMNNTIDQHEWFDVLIINAGTQYSVRLVEGASHIMKDFKIANDCRAVGRMVGAIKGVAQTFINENLSPEIKEILKKTPAAIPTVSKMLQEGVASALDAFKKNK